MTAEQEKCGLSSFLPMSCRGRAEAFARRLRSRLRSLGSHEENGAANESSWLGSYENPVTILQPRHATENDMYLDFDLLESPGSPEEEIEDPEIHRLINQDSLKQSHGDECHCPKAKEKRINLVRPIKTSSNDSDSDGSFYDTENDVDQRVMNHVNGDTNSESSKSEDSETGIYVSSQEISNQEESFATTSDCTPESSSLTEDSSTLSLRDIDFPSLESSEPYSKNRNCEHEVRDNVSIKRSDTENDIDQRLINHVNDDTNSESSKRGDCETEVYANSQETSNQEESFATISNCAPKSSSLTEDSSTLSLRDTDSPLLESNDPYSKNGTCEHEVGDNVYIKRCDNVSHILNRKEDFNCQTEDAEDTDESEEGGRIPRVRRCSSLKTGKTPPGTPRTKKIVRFADVLGLDLADVRTFLDEIPKVPTSAFEDLRDVDLSDSSSDNSLLNSINACHGIKTDKILMPLFQQPGGQPNFLDLVRDDQVCLENAFVEDPITLSIKGTVRVRNLDFHKSVYIRYTLDSWKTFADVQAVYVNNSCDGFSDKFSFLLYAHTVSIGQRLEFACRFQCKGCQYWDNNKGANYCFQCLPASHNTPVTPITGIDEWGASFY